MDFHNELDAIKTDTWTDANTASREFRIYRPDGVLSVVYFTAFETDERAIAEAEKIARYGYRVDIWRGRTRIERIAAGTAPGKEGRGCHPPEP
jgi:hypothetical protein